MSNGKIAIFHNLKEGGGKKYIFNIAKSLYNSGYIVDIFTLDPNAKKEYYYNLFCTPHLEEKNIIPFLLNYSKYINKIIEITKKIENGNYDAILITHCYLSQTPPIFEFIKKEETLNKTLYIFHELKREFYEVTSLDHYSPKRWIARIIRLFLKYREIKNINIAKTIVSNSYFSKNNLLKILSKNSIVINPLYEKKIPYINKDHRDGFSTIVTGGYTKGLHVTKSMFDKNSKLKISFIGISGFNTKLRKYYKNIEEKMYNRILSKSKFYMANNINEPLGLATIDAIQNSNIIFASNSGSHNELVKLGLNGFIYPMNDIKLSKKVIRDNMQYKLIKYISYGYNWKKYCTRLLSLCKK